MSMILAVFVANLLPKNRFLKIIFIFFEKSKLFAKKSVYIGDGAFAYCASAMLDNISPVFYNKKSKAERQSRMRLGGDGALLRRGMPEHNKKTNHAV